MEEIDYTKLGAKERTKDPRDVLLGKVQAPVSIPDTFIPDMGWLVRNYQGQTPMCGEHAGTHFQAILEHNEATPLTKRFSPRYGAIKIKDPSSSVYDGFAADAGTTTTAIFKWLQKVGADDYEPLENDITLPLATYCDPSVVTPAMDTDAGSNKIISYAFDALTFEDLKQAIYQNKAVLILIKCDNGFWGTSNPTFTQALYGHFIVAYGYDTTGIWIVDSADPSNEFSLKHITSQYITPTFFYESGTALPIPPPSSATVTSNEEQEIQVATDEVNEVENDTTTPTSVKETLLQEISLLLEKYL